jgi:hypothetical protein
MCSFCTFPGGEWDTLHFCRSSLLRARLSSADHSPTTVDERVGLISTAEIPASATFLNTGR